MQSGKQSLSALTEEIVNGLRHRNLDVNKKVSLSFYIEHHDDHKARALAKDLALEGFDTDIDAFQQHMDKWRCWANISVVPNQSNLHWVLNLLIEKSCRFNGEIAGWETNPYESGQELGQLMAQFENTWQQAV